MKWNMGWMHDTLTYMGEDPVHRKYYHDHLTFSLLYAFTEDGFEWIDCHDAEQSVLSYLRKDDQGRMAVVIFNPTP